ncbi:MAG: dihydrolipoamide acetyltransferase family protein [Chthoniobacterales bacterium]
MIHNIHLPQLELTMESATVVSILVKEGDAVTAEQGLIEVETQKANSEIPTPVNGFVRKIYVSAGDIIPEKALLCIVTDTADEAFEETASPVAPKTATASSPAPVTVPVESSDSGEGIKAAPAARKLAKDRGVDLSKVKGTGPGGRITMEDVENAGASTPDLQGDWTPLSASRISLITQMQKSLPEIPQIHVARKMDVKALSVKAEGITFTHRLVRAIGAALAKHPTLRTIINTHSIRVEPVSVAIAMDTVRGLVAPAIRDADTLSLEQIATATKDLRTRAEAGTLKREELTNAPFAISNLGMLGVDFFNAFVFHGQTAVLAVGRANEGKAWFNLALDHRVVDGAEAARFLETLQAEMLRS